ncbi:MULTISPECIES: zinc-dependent metalloprotease [unclassified Microbacterium]|uniref:zinc-dependent metalloprotease n=1 Tax=unclassified Microbacterium TaxID=2609290 RepID=UPI00214B904D|nr:MULTISPECIES: zinc-dependent metalloprotease [unclassified Microbacterium]MCR2809791.1 zinc-dependent metalloprotease [Microbacterium sp. zg.B185]WIM17898.1 zinc-dependent metalloprotease [Microbacterium sp. zg-B185]
MPDSNPEDDQTPEEQFQELIRQLFGGAGGQVDPEQLARLSGMGIDPAMMQTVMRHLQGAFSGGGDEGISWDLAKRQALHIANQDGLVVTDGQRTDLDQAFALAALWLSEATTISELATPPRSLTRGGWVEATLPVWQELAEPVATSIADALTEALRDQAPEEMQGLIQGAGRLMRTVGGSLFASQLGQVVGNLSKEVVSGGDVGIPLMPDGDAVILPQNFADFGRDLEIPDDQLALYIATRELAHARLFRHARWLRLHVIAQITDFARGIHVDTDALEELASRFNPSEPEELRRALESGALLPTRSEAQNAALTRLENLLATIEGWVDVVTDAATARLPSADRIAEAVRRRRAVGGPAEQALSSLVGLELRPRRMREAAAMWRAVTDAVGVAGRDSLWDYPDLMPTAEDIDDPAGLVARLEARARGEEPAPDEMDDALAKLLAGEDIGQAPAEGGAADDSGADASDAGSAASDEDGPAGPDDPRPV